MTHTAPVSRRWLLRTGIAASATGLLTPALTPRPAAATAENSDLRGLERRHDARLGVYATNTRTGETVAYRAEERFPMCSTFKTLAAAAILRDRDQHGEYLARIIHYTKDDLVEGSPITGKHVDTGMRVDALCSAAIQYSDNTAANLMLRQIGGPSGVTRFCRSLDDPTTRLDRWEPALNTALPGDPRDTTTPVAIGRDYGQLVLGRALNPADGALLTTWLKGNTTSEDRFHAGLPDDWEIADRTGSGDYGTTNNVGITWTTKGTPIVLVVLSTKHTQDAPWDDALVADTARVLARALASGE